MKAQRINKTRHQEKVRNAKTTETKNKNKKQNEPKQMCLCGTVITPNRKQVFLSENWKRWKNKKKSIIYIQRRLR